MNKKEKPQLLNNITQALFESDISGIWENKLKQSIETNEQNGKKTHIILKNINTSVPILVIKKIDTK